MRTEVCPTYTISLYLSGPIEIAKQVIRAEAMRKGLCVSFDPKTYIFTGGEESGYCVGLLNYPRFPCAAQELTETARDLMHKLLAATHQHSALMVTPEHSEWVSVREPL